MNTGKKLLLLGGSEQQVIAIRKAKELGFYTVLCDYLGDNPGQNVADKFYQESTTDKEAILKVAMAEQIDGIIAYASDPAAPTAAYVAEKMGLPSNPYKSVEILCNKDKFRDFLSANGFNVPVSKGFSEKEQVKSEIGAFSLPVIIKPVDSSGSKGITVLRDWNELDKALDYAFSFSRSKHIIIEEFIEKKHEYLIGGDVFVVDGKIKLWGLLNCHRDNDVNPLVPVGKSYPLDISDEDVSSVKNTLQSLVDKLNIKFGAMNVELILSADNRVWLIDVGPRSGGNMIPDLLGYIFGVDCVDLSVKTAMGLPVSLEETEGTHFYATHNLHSSKNGVYKDILFDEKLDKYIIKKCLYKTEGDSVEVFNNSAHALGIIFMKFGTREEMKNTLGSINSLYTVELGD